MGRFKKPDPFAVYSIEDYYRDADGNWRLKRNR
jgi:hypothetical protein